MYLHIGLNYLIKTKYILGIFDIENTSVSPATRAMFRFCGEKKKNVWFHVTTELPKSYIIYCEKGKTTLFLTQFSVSTLKKRFTQNGETELR